MKIWPITKNWKKQNKKNKKFPKSIHVDNRRKNKKEKPELMIGLSLYTHPNAMVKVSHLLRGYKWKCQRVKNFRISRIRSPHTYNCFCFVFFSKKIILCQAHSRVYNLGPHEKKNYKTWSSFVIWCFPLPPTIIFWKLNSAAYESLYDIEKASPRR